MSHSVQMPALGESVTEGTVTRWLKREGDTVAEDEPLLEVSTDKVDTEVPAPYSGVLEKILVQEDETVEVGADLAIIGDGSGAAAAAPAAAPATSAAPPVAEPAPEPAAPAVAAAPAPAAASPAGDATADDAGTAVTMPAMGESVTEGTVTRWLKNVGDAIAEDEPIVEIATDKVDAEVPSPVAGTLLQILAEEDATVEVGSPLAVIGVGAPTPATAAPAPAAAAPAAPAPAAAPEPAPVPAAAPAASAPTVPSASGARTGYVTPVVRKLATDHGVDLATVVGTGVGGRIRREDVLAAAAGGATAPATTAAPAIPAPTTPAAAPVVAAAPTPTQVPATSLPVAAAAPGPAPVAPVTSAPPARTDSLIGTTQPAPRIRQAIARSMMHAVTTSAQTTTIIEVDATRIAALLGRTQAAFRSREGIALTLMPFFVKAAIEAAKANPLVNSSLSDDLSAITYHAAVHLGVAVDTPRGQIAPVVHHADDLNVTALARRIADLTDRARRGALGPDELSGATFTVSDAGSPGALIDTPIVVPPQAATLALGAVAKRPVVVTDVDGSDVIAVRSIATMALSYDQRFVDGSDAAHYLAAVKRRVEDGDFEADLGV
jgi:2-oxoglutarate dehydrogenase E2 component (dihydrolipoamide succinyltransferase)